MQGFSESMGGQRQADDIDGGRAPVSQGILAEPNFISTLPNHIMEYCMMFLDDVRMNPTNSGRDQIEGFSPQPCTIADAPKLR